MTNSYQVADSPKTEARQIIDQSIESLNKSTSADLDLENRTRKGKRYLQILQSGGHLSC